MDPSQRLPQASNSAGNSHKRKADAQQDNERLSKRLSLLNIERDGAKLYVPVESPQRRRTPTTTSTGNDNDNVMHLDDTKHKVYIYNIDEELADDDSEPDEARLVFLPDIEKRLRETRIPPQVLANSDGELAGMQVVLYSDPKSLSVPEDKDGVRKAILEARRRHRACQAAGDADSSSTVAVDTKTPEPAPGQAETGDIEMDVD